MELKKLPEYYETNKNNQKVFTLKKAASTVAEAWKTASAEVKERINKIYLERAEQYKKDLKAWEDSLTEEEVERQNKYLSHLRKQGKKQVPKNLSTANKVKRPLTAFFLYSKHMREHGNRARMTVTEHASQSAKEWRALSDADKAPYEAQAKQLWEDYQRRVSEIKSSS